MNVKKYKDYFEFNGYKYVLKETEQVKIDRLYYQIVLDRNISYAEYLDIIDYISSPAYRKKTIEEIFNTFYIK